MFGGLKSTSFFFWPVGQKEMGRRCGKNLKGMRETSGMDTSVERIFIE